MTLPAFLPFQVAATTAVAAWSLHGEYDAEKNAMLLMLAAAFYSEYIGADRDPTDARQGIMGGAPLGALALPWLFVSRVGGPNFPLFAFWIYIATNFALLPGLPWIVARGASVAAISAGARELNYVNVGHEPYPTEWTIATVVAVHVIIATSFARDVPVWFPRVFTRWEAALVATGAALCLGDVSMWTAHRAAGALPDLHLTERKWEHPTSWMPLHIAFGQYDDAQLAMEACVLIACVLTLAAPTLAPEVRTRATILIAAGTSFLAAWGTTVALRLGKAFRGHEGIAHWFVDYVTGAEDLMNLAAYWALVFGAALFAIRRLGVRGAPTIALRKAYHLLAVVAFAPASLPVYAARRLMGHGLPHPEMLAVAYAVALLVFALGECVRTSRAGWLGRSIDDIFSRFTDSRDDHGSVVISHTSLLVGVAVPLWLNHEKWSASAELDHSVGALAPLAGIISLGLGDAAASVFGVYFGKTSVCAGCGKTVEGAVAGAVANMAGLLFAWWVVNRHKETPWGCLLMAGVGTAALEATTEQLDNAFLPLHMAAVLQLVSRNAALEHYQYA